MTYKALAVIVGAAALSALSFAAGSASKRVIYSNAITGISIDGPAFASASRDTLGSQVIILGPVEDNFAPNLNVMIQPAPTPLATYVTTSVEQMKQAGFHVNAQRPTTIAGLPAYILDYEGQAQEKDVHFLAACLKDGDRIVLATCAASKGTFEKNRAAFTASMRSIKIAK